VPARPNSPDIDGIVVTRERGRRRVRLFALLAGALIAAGAVWLVLEIRRPAPPSRARAPVASEPAATVETPERQLERVLPGAYGPNIPPEVRDRLLRDLEEGREPSLHLDQLGPGDGTGIHAFPPPGTKPLKGGLLVPEDFELPPGFVRHYQTTDDGERVPAILMFHPDHKPVDESGNPIPLPADRIVPPDLAPPGMPLVDLEPPPVRRDNPPPPRP
jgi:hypothetical protein